MCRVHLFPSAKLISFLFFIFLQFSLLATSVYSQFAYYFDPSANLFEVQISSFANKNSNLQMRNKYLNEKFATFAPYTLHQRKPINLHIPQLPPSFGSPCYLENLYSSSRCTERIKFSNTKLLLFVAAEKKTQIR